MQPEPAPAKIPTEAAFRSSRSKDADRAENDHAFFPSLNFVTLVVVGDAFLPVPYELRLAKRS